MSLSPQNFSVDTIDFKELFKSYTKHWLWFVVSLVACIVFVFVNLRYETPEYLAQATIQVVDNRASSELNVFSDLEILSGGGGSNAIEDEILNFKSRSNLIEVTKNLNLNVKVYALGDIIDSEVYQNRPFIINFIESDSIIHNASYSFYIHLSNNTTFGFSTEKDGPVKVFPFGKNIPTRVGDVIVTPTTLGNYSGLKGRKYRIDLTPVTIVAQNYQSRMGIAPAQKGASILGIYLNDPIQIKAKNIINELIFVYNKNTVQDARAIADKTSTFINDRINSIYSDLSSVDETAENFMTSRGLTDIASQSSLNLSTGAVNEQALRDTQIQLNIASSMQDIVDNSEGFEILPSNVGLDDASIATTTARYNELVLQREKFLISSNEKNPVIVNLDQQLTSLKRNMLSSLNSKTNNLNLQANSLSQQLSKINSRLYSAPKNERTLRDITRKQETKETLYLYLLQKREESQIAFASSEPNIKVIDSAYSYSNAPVGTSKRIIYLGAIFMGLLIPFFIIYIKGLLDTKIHNKIDLEKLVEGIPVLGELPRLTKKEGKLIQNEDRSVLAESLRIMRTSLDYLIKSKKTAGKGNIIFITSSTSGEGKTFISSNLSMVLASTNKKVLLIGADIRNPKLYTFFSGDKIDKMSKYVRNKDAGLTEYLYDDKLNIKDIINPMLVYENTIDVVYSGRIPPNPAELLMSNRLQEMFKEVSEIYDYVIVDTAPLMVVADTLLISDYANHIVYVTRAHITEKKAIHFPLKLQKEGKINGLSFIVNDVRSTNLGYGGKYGYGYGYGKIMKKWWKF